MNKKIIIIFIIIILVTVAGAIFWEDSIESYFREKRMRKFSDFPEDYVITKSPTGIIIENEKDQLRIEIPEGWRVIKGTDMSGTTLGNNIVFYTPDYCRLPQQGCLAEIEIYRLTGFEPYPGPLGYSADGTREEIEYHRKQELEVKDNISYEEVVYVNHHEALKWVSENRKGLSIEIPVRDKVYLFHAILFSEKCGKEFEKILDNIEIK